MGDFTLEVKRKWVKSRLPEGIVAYVSFTGVARKIEFILMTLLPESAADNIQYSVYVPEILLRPLAIHDDIG